MNAGIVLIVLLVVALIASIVCTVIVYRRFVSTGDMYGGRPVDKRAMLSSFLRFDTLVIEKLLKVLYLFGAISTVFFALAILISSIFVSVNSFISTLVGIVVGVPISEVIHRIVYEFLMLNIVIARNTTDIKKMMHGGKPQTTFPLTPPTPSVSPAPTTPPTPTTPPAYTPRQTQQTLASLVQPRSSMGTMSEAATPQSVCPHCHTPLKPGQKFCGVCGTSVM